jgi:HD-like signal output (HDOD) protein
MTSAANPDLNSSQSALVEDAQTPAAQSALEKSSEAAVQFLNRIGLIEKMAPLRLLNQEMRQEHPQMDELYRIVEATPEITKRFLKIANSPWFNSRLQIDSPMMAFSRFGTEGFYRLVVATYLQDGIGELTTKFRIWPHLEWTARAAEMVAEQLAPSHQHLVFGAAILHDAVIPPMERELQDYLYFLECALAVDPVVTNLETNCHQFNHAQAAAELAGALDFEPAIVEALRAHHSETISSITDRDARIILGVLLTTKRALSVARSQRKTSFETPAEKILLREIADAFDCSTGLVINVIAEVVDNLHLPAAV